MTRAKKELMPIMDETLWKRRKNVVFRGIRTRKELQMEKSDRVTM